MVIIIFASRTRPNWIHIYPNRPTIVHKATATHKVALRHQRTGTRLSRCGLIFKRALEIHYGCHNDNGSWVWCARRGDCVCSAPKTMALSQPDCMPYLPSETCTSHRQCWGFDPIASEMSRPSPLRKYIAVSAVGETRWRSTAPLLIEN